MTDRNSSSNLTEDQPQGQERESHETLSLEESYQEEEVLEEEENRDKSRSEKKDGNSQQGNPSGRSRKMTERGQAYLRKTKEDAFKTALSKWRKASKVALEAIEKKNFEEIAFLIDELEQQKDHIESMEADLKPLLDAKEQTAVAVALKRVATETSNIIAHSLHLAQEDTNLRKS